MSTKFDLSNDNGSTRNFFDASFFSLSLYFYDQIKKENQKRSLITDNDGRYSVSLSLFFMMIIGQLHVNIILLQYAFVFFCQTDHSLSLFLVFFSSLYTKIYDIIVGAKRKYRTTTFINLLPKKRKKKTYIKMYSSFHLCPCMCYWLRDSLFFVL